MDGIAVVLPDAEAVYFNIVRNFGSTLYSKSHEYDFNVRKNQDRYEARKDH
jgi:hypothetical protein